MYRGIDACQDGALFRKIGKKIRCFYVVNIIFPLALLPALCNSISFVFCTYKPLKYREILFPFSKDLLILCNMHTNTMVYGLIHDIYCF